MSNSKITYSKSATIFEGSDAVEFVRAAAIKTAIDLYVATGIKANRAYTPKNMLAAASSITKKKYKRGQLALASADLKIWIDTMRAALPVVDERSP